MDRKLFAIFGDPVEHSLSPRMHNRAFRELGERACYGRYRLENGELLRQKVLDLGLAGLNITVPHKEYAYAACDFLDPFARKVGSVNTIVVHEGKLSGYNTDAPGFLRVVESFGGVRSVVFLGAGGTARSSAPLLREAGYAVTLLNRSAPRLGPFAEAGFETATYAEFTPRAFDLVVNMSSAGLKDDSLPAPEGLLRELLRGARGALDVIYGRKTPFLRLAESLGIPARDGLAMLLYQGVIAFEIFTEGRHDPAAVEAALRAALAL